MFDIQISSRENLHIPSFPAVLIFFLSLPFLSFAGAETNHTKKEKKFDTGKMIMEHIGDGYSWHIADIGEHAIAIPLPVIIYAPEIGLDLFLSSRFEHGHATFNGYHLKEGKLAAEDGRVFYDFSITKNAAAVIISALLLLLIFTSAAKAYKKNRGKAPKGLQSFLEPLILFVRDEIAKPSIGKKFERYMPYLLTIFFFIWLNNLLGIFPIFPGGANVTGSIGVTMTLALFTFIITTLSANKDYWTHIFNTPGVPWWLKIPVPLMPLVEFMGIFIKPFVLMVRLFANITAGHIIALAFFSLIFIFGEMNAWLGLGVSIISVAFTVFMTVLELLVGFLQAYVFTLLTAIYFGMAIEEHHHEIKPH